MAYKHTQVGYLIIYILLAMAILFGMIITQAGFDYFILAVMIFIIFLLASFATLNVTIDENHLRIKFGYGIFIKRFILKEIVSAETVKNHWYFGWGIRLWMWPHMWIFNVSGFDAVEIEMKGGKIYRIGTDEPDKLKQAIKNS